MLNIEDISRLIPHARPFIMLEAVSEVEPGQHGTGVMLAAWDELWGLPDNAKPSKWPNVFIIESAAQLLAVVNSAAHSSAGTSARPPINYLAAASRVQFKQELDCGVRYEVHVKVVKRLQSLLYASFYANVEDTEIASGTLIVTDYRE